ncbi:ABC transporter ATP-binding protein [Rhodobacter sp. 24-YEA-8]|uniref:ABC transporter ATP-binding protein n=1 Tax=Rhodobacter sp. 24-YEA-8 TaxID=1884310 RepID=UPI000894CB45|nr:ABC transporter ATP-binding protein [Rhodobacter sp. 24-YEA-8]SED22060.1 amino acid/amide ABC transporter ATP-binding protein 1, HAAT family [Rhodobacter sp. 24-YEA-8]
MTEPATILACEGVTKQYGALKAVNALDFTVRRGEVLGIGGPNGAGKTTLFDVLSGLSPATAGRVLLAGKEITADAPDRICHQGLARTFQLNAAFDSMSLRDNVRLAAQFGRRARAMPGLRLSRATQEAADQALDFVGLTPRGATLAGQAPVIDRKLLMIASALATDPKILLMDEPVGGLTHAETDVIMDCVQRLKARGVTIILIEHVMRFLVGLSERVMILHHGEKIFEGPPGGLVEDATVVDVYLGAGASERLRGHLNGGAA